MGRERESTVVACFALLLGASACDRSHPRAATAVEGGGPSAELRPAGDIAGDVKRIALEYTRRTATRPERLAAEAISAAAAIVGERCIDAASELSVRAHHFPVGQRIFSDEINALLTGDVTRSWSPLPPSSVFGSLRSELSSQFQSDDFPPVEGVLRAFAAGVGKPEDWGRVPLSLPRERWPESLPLRVAFDTRADVDAALAAIASDKPRCVNVCTLALAGVLNEVRDEIDRHEAIVLALETINGMAKTAPMKDTPIDAPSAELREAQHQVVKMGAPQP
jgi:hypothetical protein